jgi:putative transposase
VINRGNDRQKVFRKQADYQSFTDMMAEAVERLPMRVLSWSLMPNHFHMVLWPFNDGELSRWMQWLMTCHVRRYHRHYQSSGHVWQGRFKAFAIQEDGHYLTVLRYVEMNPLRAGLVERAEQWPWSSLYALKRTEHPLLSPGPLERPKNWLELVNHGQTDDELGQIRNCTQRQSPMGEKIWVKRMATKLGLQSSISPRGRPRKQEKK